MRKYLFIALLTLLGIPTAYAQQTSCANGVVGLYSVHIGTGACDVAGGAALAAEIAARQALATNVLTPAEIASALSLGTMANQNANAVNITGGTLVGDGSSTTPGASNIITSPTINTPTITSGTLINPTITGGSVDNTTSVIPQGSFTAQTLANIATLGGVTPEMFGAVGDGTHDDTTAVRAALAAAMSSNRALYLLNYYAMTQGLVVDLTNYTSHGPRIIGNGRARSGLIFSSAVTGPGLLITLPAGGAAFYGEYTNFNVQCNAASACVQVGRTDLTDQLNETIFDLLVQNGSTASGALAIQFNAVYNIDVRIVGNTGGKSTSTTTAALQCRQCQFSRFFGSVGNAYASIWLTAGENTANTFMSMDTEVAHIGILSDSASNHDNQFLGGQMALLDYGVYSTAGARNVLRYPNLSIGATNLFGTGSATGFKLEAGPGISTTGTPSSFPASGTAFVNTFGQAFGVSFASGTISSIAINGATLALSAPAFVTFEPGDSMVVTWTGSTPGWVFRPL